MALRIYVEAEGGGKVEGGPGIKKQIFVKKNDICVYLQYIALCI
jgi:hypothetical protein